MKPVGDTAARLPANDFRIGEFGAGKARTMANFKQPTESERAAAAAGTASGTAHGDMSVDAGDLSLVRRVQAGERAAFDLLVLKYQHKVVKLVMRYLRNPADAEDVAQEAFIKAYRALPQFRGDSAFYTWLYRIAINTAKNALVSRERNPVGYELDAHGGDHGGDHGPDMSNRLKDPDTPEGLALSEEIRNIVHTAIGGLPEDLRTAIVLRELEGLSYEEIAVSMKCPVGTVRSRIFRAREAIDERLREVFDGGLGRAQELL
jgi:RNA polymerase sigma-70 factor, ECF subfamily